MTSPERELLLLVAKVMDSIGVPQDYEIRRLIAAIDRQEKFDWFNVAYLSLMVAIIAGLIAIVFQMMGHFR